jgi:hypothetical protein
MLNALSKLSAVGKREPTRKGQKVIDCRREQLQNRHRRRINVERAVRLGADPTGLNLGSAEEEVDKGSK